MCAKAYTVECEECDVAECPYMENDLEPPAALDDEYDELPF